MSADTGRPRPPEIGASLAIRPSQRRMLEAIRDGDVGWRLVSSGDGMYGTTKSFRHHIDDRYTIVTDSVRRLIARGFVETWDGGGFGYPCPMGGCELTWLGRQALGEPS